VQKLSHGRAPSTCPLTKGPGASPGAAVQAASPRAAAVIVCAPIDGEHVRRQRRQLSATGLVPSQPARYRHSVVQLLTMAWFYHTEFGPETLAARRRGSTYGWQTARWAGLGDITGSHNSECCSRSAGPRRTAATPGRNVTDFLLMGQHWQTLLVARVAPPPARGAHPGAARTSLPFCRGCLPGSGTALPPEPPRWSCLEL